MTVSHLWSAAVLGVSPTPAPRATLTLRSLAPNPAARELSVRFALADAGPARLELFDVAGRSVRVLEVGGPGERTARFEHLDALPAGLYVVRLSQRGQARAARVAIVR
jgi:hypothetical protein